MTERSVRRGRRQHLGHLSAALPSFCTVRQSLPAAKTCRRWEVRHRPAADPGCQVSVPSADAFTWKTLDFVPKTWYPFTQCLFCTQLCAEQGQGNARPSRHPAAVGDGGLRKGRGIGWINSTRRSTSPAIFCGTTCFCFCCWAPASSLPCGWALCRCAGSAPA